MKESYSVVLLFGGVSSEHDISCMSAQTFMNAMEADGGYTVYPVYIDREGAWFLYEGDKRALRQAPLEEYRTPVAILPGLGKDCFLLLGDEGPQSLTVDVVIPVLHGLNGEDGTVQGLLEMARIPYVGCGVLASALGMDKVYTKKIVAELGIRQAAFVDLRRGEILDAMDTAVQKVEAAFAYPVFVKPSRAGSSVGVTKASNRQELMDGLRKAAKEDRRVLVEEFIQGREVECAVLGGEDPKVANVGEILAAAEFYDFDAKYVNAESKTVVPADICESARQEIRRDARAIFQAIDGSGLARVDFFIEQKSGEVIFNEINTFPGFTNISMYPMLWQAEGLSVEEQVRELIQIAIERKPLYGA